MLGLCSVLGLAIVAAVLVGSSVVARHRAAAAADLAALASAAHAGSGTVAACALAAEVAAGMSAELTGCSLVGDTAEISTAVPLRLGRFGVGVATGHARAGPVFPVPGG